MSIWCTHHQASNLLQRGLSTSSSLEIAPSYHIHRALRSPAVYCCLAPCRSEIRSALANFIRWILYCCRCESGSRYTHQTGGSCMPDMLTLADRNIRQNVGQEDCQGLTSPAAIACCHKVAAWLRCLLVLADTCVHHANKPVGLRWQFPYHTKAQKC